MVKFARVPEVAEPEVETLRFSFDLAPVRWPSELLEAWATGHLETRWVARDADASGALLALVPGERLVCAARLVPDDGGWSLSEVATRAAWSSSVEVAALADLPDLLAEAVEVAQIFDSILDAVERLLAPFRTNARGSQQRRPESAYAALAARYVQLVAAGERHPGKVLAAELGMSPVTLAQRIREARSEPLSMLTEARPGAAGGALTERARLLLLDAGLQQVAAQVEQAPA